MIAESRFEEATGGVIGYCGRWSARACSPTASLKGRKRWIVGANKKDHHLDYAVPGRDFPEPEFADVTTVFAGDPCALRHRAGDLSRHRGRPHLQARDEVLRVDALRVSRRVRQARADDHGLLRPRHRPHGGGGEQSHDDDGIIWPMPIAPFEVIVTIPGKEENVHAAANDVYEKLLPPASTSCSTTATNARA